MNLNMIKVLDDLDNEYIKYYTTYKLFSELKDEYEIVKDADYKSIREQRDTEKFKLLKIHTSLKEQRNKMVKLFETLSDDEKMIYADEYKRLYDEYLNLNRGAIQYRKNITIPHYIKRNIQKYNIKF